jgi:hypothetical protein
MVHVVPQAPQWRTSVSRSTQMPPQRVWPAGQSQRPAWHVVPPEQVTPQAPQFMLSIVASTQAAPHFMRPVAHIAAQALTLHTWPMGHALPQAPQFAGSLETSTHAPLQAV